MPPIRRRSRPKAIAIARHRVRDRAKRQQRLTVIMVRHIMAMPVERPVEILFKSMRMAMLCNHFGMIGHNLEQGGHMACARRDRPYRKRQAQKRRKRGLSDCPHVLHRSGPPDPSLVAARCPCRPLLPCYMPSLSPYATKLAPLDRQKPALRSSARAPSLSSAAWSSALGAGLRHPRRDYPAMAAR